MWIQQRNIMVQSECHYTRRVSELQCRVKGQGDRPEMKDPDKGQKTLQTPTTTVRLWVSRTV